MTAAALITPRLRLVPWDTAAHGPLLSRLVALPTMMRHVGDGRTLGAAGVAERASFATAHWLARGWGWRVGVHRADGDALAVIAANRLGAGTRGLAHEEVEVGWFVAPERQGDGYAVEAAGAVVADLLGRLGATSVIARVQPANAASIRVAEHLGMTRDGTTTGRLGEPLHVYRIGGPG